MNNLNSEAQKPPSPLRFSLPFIIIITITSNEPSNAETHKTDRNPPIRNHKRKTQTSVGLWNMKSAVMYAVVREFLMILSDIFLTRWSKCTNQCDVLVWTYREQCVHFTLSDISWRGSKCTNHRKTISIACFLYFMSIFLSLFCGWFILVGRLNNPIVAAAIGKLKTGFPFKNLGKKFFRM